MVSDSNCSLLNNIQIGSRIECCEHYGTVRYVGPVEGHPSPWLGIEWDDPSRGKHDGSVAGTRYFQTSHPTAGSFVRPGKAQFGKDAVKAICSRYGHKETPSEANVNQLKLLNLQKEINAPFLEMVGFDKINEKLSNFNDLQVVSLRLKLVNGPGEYGKLTEICPNLLELDISKNLLYKWSDIFLICAQLSHLKWLNCSENFLKFPETIENLKFPTLTHLICGQMKLNWNDILKLSRIFPNLEEFRVQYNLISEINVPDESYFQNLKTFDLEGNYVVSWDEINKLGCINTLEQLIVANIGISRIKFPDCQIGENINLFSNLKQIVISKNLIDNWESINELNKLQNLDNLRFIKNPILEQETPATCEQLIVASIEKLTILNGTSIKTDERNGAEYDYIKKYGLEWLTAKKNEDIKKEFLRKHPRYAELIKKHGEPEESELVVKTQTLKSSLVLVNVEFNDLKISKRLPATMSLQKLVTLVQRLFKIPERPTLFYVTSSQPDMEIEMDDEFKDINYYSIQDGDKIIVRSS